MIRPPISGLALLLIGTAAQAAGFGFVTKAGHIGFLVPDEWKVIQLASKPAIAIAAFQVENSADAGTPDSTNFAVMVYHTGTPEGQEAWTRTRFGRQYGAVPPVESTVRGWHVFRQEAAQRSTPYTMIDASKACADEIILVRAAWPHLRLNPPNYDHDMNDAVDTLVQSIQCIDGPLELKDGVSVYRPIQ